LRDSAHWQIVAFFWHSWHGNGLAKERSLGPILNHSTKKILIELTGKGLAIMNDLLLLVLNKKRHQFGVRNVMRIPPSFGCLTCKKWLKPKVKSVYNYIDTI
jgi:hypothetical protein